MSPRTLLRLLPLPMLLLGSRAALAEGRDVAPLLGDLKRGAVQYRLNCAGCHGANGQGDGMMAPKLKPAPGAIRNAELLTARSEVDLYRSVHDGGGAVGKSNTMPAFANALSLLDTWDVLAFLEQDMPRVVDFYSGAGRVLAKIYTLDNDASERLKKDMGGTAVPTELATLQVITVFNGDREPGRDPVVEPQDPVTLDSLKPKDKLGHLVFEPVQLASDAKPVSTGIAIDAKGKIVKVLSASGDPAEDDARNKLLVAYVGQGQKSGVHAPLKGGAAPKPAKGKAKGKAEAAPSGTPGTWVSMDAAYLRALEAITMYDKEEHDRTWADAPSK